MNNIVKSELSRNMLKAIRIKHWVKNLLVFVPLVMAHEIEKVNQFLEALVYFFCLSLVASGTYLVNDIVDIDFDKVHEKNKFRPIAAGLIRTKFAIWGSIALILTGLLVCWSFNSFASFIVLNIYLMLTLLYTKFLKNVLGLDIIVLAFLFSLRIIGGTFAAEVKLSSWLLSFSIFLFFSLAAAKRYTQIANSETNEIPGRSYLKSDLETIKIFGSTTGIAASLVVATYMQDVESAGVYYKNPALLLLEVPLVLFWIFYLWLQTGRKQVDSDPIDWALRDRISQICLVVAITVGAFATFL
jgi:4-hydroxybenzoate polyprenyltransferase